MSPMRQTLSAWAFRFRGPIIVISVLLVTASTAAALAAFGDSGIEEHPGFEDGTKRVRTDGERCAVPLLDGWTWRPASWSFVSPAGATVGFNETLHGRPLYPEWDEAIDDMTARYVGRDDVALTREPDMVRIDFGENGGLSVIQRFDRVGCHLIFSPSSSTVRAAEIDEWELLINSVERTYPQE
jgi:hypothetical protein